MGPRSNARSLFLRDEGAEPESTTANKHFRERPCPGVGAGRRQWSKTTGPQLGELLVGGGRRGAVGTLRNGGRPRT